MGDPKTPAQIAGTILARLGRIPGRSRPHCVSATHTYPIEMAKPKRKHGGARRGAGPKPAAGEPRKRRGEILLADSEHEIVARALGDTPLGVKARDLLLDWARTFSS